MQMVGSLYIEIIPLRQPLYPRHWTGSFASPGYPSFAHTMILSSFSIDIPDTSIFICNNGVVSQFGFFAKTLKNRMIFIVVLEKSFHEMGWLASLDFEGENGNILKIHWESIKRPFVKQMLETTDLIQDIREMGFKRLVMNNGKQEWNIDLKN